jgi:tetratricopeptide (TPR) repeat protein
MNEKNKQIIEQESTDYAQMLKARDYHTSTADYGIARKCYETAAALNPDDAAPYIGLGIIDYQQDLFDDAEIAFRVACRLDPQCGRAYCGLAMTAQKKGNYEKAFEMYLKCLELESDNLLPARTFRLHADGSFAKVIPILSCI